MIEKTTMNNSKKAWAVFALALMYAFGCTCLLALCTTFIWNKWIVLHFNVSCLSFWKVEVIYFSITFLRGCGKGLKSFLLKK
jgi:hypothetical protein